MKRTSFLIFTAILLLFSCSKDELPLEKQFSQYQLTDIEKDFFDFNKSINIQSRESKSLRITPESMRVYEHMLNENKNSRFAEGIHKAVGTPLWNHAFTNRGNKNEYYVFVPLYNKKLAQINGYVSAMNIRGQIVLNGLTRKQLLSEFSVNSGIKLSALSLLSKQEFILQGETSLEVKDAICKLQREVNENGGQYVGEDLLIESDPCLPELKEICIDQENGYHWFGGLDSPPPHLDHDQDGIVNSNDQDWIGLGISQSDFEQRVRDYWDAYYYDDYGDYDDFWSDHYEYYVDFDGGQSLDGFLDILDDWWSDFDDWFDDFWDDFWGGGGDPFDDLYDEPQGWWDIDCYYDPINEDDNDISTRSITCFKFYAWDCYDNPDYNWWSFYDGYHDGSILLHRVNNYLDNVLTGQVKLWTLYDIAEESGCDPLSTDFEHCLDWHFNEHRDYLLNYFYAQEFPGLNFLPMVRRLAANCELGGGTESEYHDCINTQYNEAKSNIESFLTDNNLDLTFDEFLEIYLEECNTCNILNYEDEFFYDYRSRMSEAELEIFDTLPEDTQLQFLYNAKIASFRAKTFYPESLYNGVGDAFRHAYFNGLNCNSIGCELAENLSTAHEDRPPTYEFSFKENEMDLFNNDIGRVLSSSVPAGETLLTHLFQAIQNGQLRYLNNLASNNRATNGLPRNSGQ